MNFRNFLILAKILTNNYVDIYSSSMALISFFWAAGNLWSMKYSQRKNPLSTILPCLIKSVKIDKAAWIPYLIQGLSKISKSPQRLAEEILQISQFHPYYAQQLAAMVWQFIQNDRDKSDAVEQAAQFIITQHDNDYERLWLSFNQTDKKVLLALAQMEPKPFSDVFLKKRNIGAVSTVFSSIKRLTEESYLFKQNGLYEIEDPFFKKWLIFRRHRFIFPASS